MLDEPELAMAALLLAVGTTAQAADLNAGNGKPRRYTLTGGASISEAIWAAHSARKRHHRRWAPGHPTRAAFSAEFNWVTILLPLPIG
jgi:hypothetical protein